MGWTGKAKGNSEGWGMGFLLVFFPEGHHANTIIDKKESHLFSSSSSSSSSLPSPSSSSPSPSFRPHTAINALLKRTNSTHLLAKAQSTISICALLIFTTLLLFTLSTFEPTAASTHLTYRRQLSSIRTTNTIMSPRFSLFWLKRSPNQRTDVDAAFLAKPSHALQGMGALYTRGTKAMNDLVLAHVSESVTVSELRMFLRLFHRSALSFRSDLLFIFPPSKGISFTAAIEEENSAFFKLIEQVKELNGTSISSMTSFDPTQFFRSIKKEKEITEPIWGRKNRSNVTADGDSDSTRLSYGSVVGFEVDELDPENSLAGFLDHVPMSLRRWACYPMLLGRVRRNFKHVLLVSVKDMVLLGDPLGYVRNRSPESVVLTTVTQGKHSRKNSDKNQQQKSVNPALIMGGARGVRRLSSAMLTEIARSTMQHKRKNSASELGLFNQLVSNEFLLKNVKLTTETEPVTEASSVGGLNWKWGGTRGWSQSVVRIGNNNIDMNSIIMKHICSYPIDSSIYTDCYHLQQNKL